MQDNKFTLLCVVNSNSMRCTVLPPPSCVMPSHFTIVMGKNDQTTCDYAYAYSHCIPVLDVAQVICYV